MYQNLYSLHEKFKQLYPIIFLCSPQRALRETSTNPIHYFIEDCAFLYLLNYFNKWFTWFGTMLIFLINLQSCFMICFLMTPVTFIFPFCFFNQMFVFFLQTSNFFIEIINQSIFTNKFISISAIFSHSFQFCHFEKISYLQEIELYLPLTILYGSVDSRW